MIDDEKLVRFVEKHDMLYNKSNPASKYPSKKQLVWAKIARYFGTTEDHCIRRWTTLRDRYTKERRRMDAAVGGGETITMSWPLYESMHFLAMHIVPRPERKSIRHTNDPLLSPLRLQDSPMRTASMSGSPMQSPSGRAPNSPCFTEVSESWAQFPELKLFSAEKSTHEQPAPASPPTSQSPLPAGGKKRKENPPEDADKEFLEAVHMFKKMCTERETRVENAAINGFGQMIMSTIAEMSVTKQTKAMQRVTDVVMALKLEPED